LSAKAVLVAGAAAGLGALAVVVFAAAVMSSLTVLVVGVLCLGIFWAYSLPPISLNYRGGGELLEAVGVGVALPAFNALLQSDQVHARDLSALWGYLVLSLASAVASGLSDERSDRAGGKTTVVTVFGNRRARRGIEALVLLGVATWCAAALLVPAALAIWQVAIAGGLAIVHYVRLRRVSPSALTDAFEAQTPYKRHLHAASWQSGGVLALLIALRGLV
jgi:1,4-dihydroxy-2-naphthoate octaprenyltransferase/chlorophyll synthase